MNIGDTASSRIQVMFATLSSRECGGVDRVIDMSSGRGLTRSHR